MANTTNKWSINLYKIRTVIAGTCYGTTVILHFFYVAIVTPIVILIVSTIVIATMILFLVRGMLEGWLLFYFCLNFFTAKSINKRSRESYLVLCKYGVSKNSFYRFWRGIEDRSCVNFIFLRMSSLYFFSLL